jgi:hypothetical protein
MTIPLGHSRVQHVYPSLAPDFDNLVAALPEQQRQLLLQQKQQQPAQKRRTLSTGAAAAAALQPTDAARHLLLALRCLLRWEGRRLQDQELPLLLQLLLFGGRAPAVEGVGESVNLVPVEEDESLNRQLMQGERELLISREVQPRGSLQQRGQGSGEAEGSGGSPAAVVGVKRERE